MKDPSHPPLKKDFKHVLKATLGTFIRQVKCMWAFSSMHCIPITVVMGIYSREIYTYCIPITILMGIYSREIIGAVHDLTQHLVLVS